MNVINLKEGKHPIIIKPNLGQPVLLNLRDFKGNDGIYVKKVVFEAYIIAIPKHSTQDILESFHLNAYIQPILKDEGTFEERRGERYPIQIVEIEVAKDMDFEEHGVISEVNYATWDMYESISRVGNIFGDRTRIHKVLFQIKNIKSIERLLGETGRKFLLFDIVHDVPNKIVDKINFHGIALYDKDWANFRFIHATDFHVARRNDFISKFLKDKQKKKRKRSKKLKDLQDLGETTISSRDFEFKEEVQEERLEDLRFGKYNFNYNLRKLNEYINNRVKENELDFVLMTGDLIDYLDVARGNYQYKNNFHVFFDILLGLNKGLDKPPYLGEDHEYINKKEIMAPLFTIVGNHDYRKAHYSVRMGNVPKIFGMTKKDLRRYHDIKFFNYLKALYSRDAFLKDYIRYFNPNLNYKVKVGDQYNIIFLDTGQDSIADMHDLVKGSPSTKGLIDNQIDLLRAYIQLCQDEKIIIAMHTPPVSPNLSYLKRRKVKRMLKIKRDLRWEDLYEQNLQRFNDTGRLEKILNLKYQTIMYNWAKFLKICTGSDEVIRRKVDLILCGHTHTLKEFRLKEVKKDESEMINIGFYFAPIIIDIPCEIYTSKYRDSFKEFKDPMDFKVWFDVNKPFIFQTQAIGPISLKYKFKPPGFRYFSIENNQIKEVKVFSLHLK
jgi:predicted MPP superfamily phosphohydrolase